MQISPEQKAEAQKLYEELLGSAADIVDLANAYDVFAETAAGNRYANGANWLRLDKYKMAAALFFQCSADDVTRERRQVGKLLALRWLRQTMDAPKNLTEAELAECERSTDEQLNDLFAKTGRPRWEPTGDVWSLIAACMYGVPIAEVTEGMRKLGKEAGLKATSGLKPERPPIMTLPHNTGKTCSLYHPARKEMLHKMDGKAFIVRPIDPKGNRPDGLDCVYIPLPEYGVALWHFYDQPERQALLSETKPLADVATFGDSFSATAPTIDGGFDIPPGAMLVKTGQIHDESIYELQTEFADTKRDAYQPSRHYDACELVAYKGHTWKAAGSDAINIAPQRHSGDWLFVGWDTENRDRIQQSLDFPKTAEEIAAVQLDQIASNYKSFCEANGVRPATDEEYHFGAGPFVKVDPRYKLEDVLASADKVVDNRRELCSQWKEAIRHGSDIY